MLIHKMHVDTPSSTAIVRVRAYGKNTSFRNRKIHLRFSPPAARPVEARMTSCGWKIKKSDNSHSLV